MKKFIALLLTVVLTATVAVGGTLAYLQDTETDHNVMTLGNVQITQNEYQRKVGADGKYETKTIDGIKSYILEEYDNTGKALYPAIIPNGGTVNGVKWDYDKETRVRMTQVNSWGTADVFVTPNAMDKFVTVTNDGTSDAYVRTLIAFEAGTELADPAYPDQSLIATEMRAAEAADNTNFNQPWTIASKAYMTIDDEQYLVYELLYTGANLNNGSFRHENGVLPAGETTYPSLCQVYMASRATNEDCAALDGNDNGVYDILVLSQAVQVEGFETATLALDTAFGDVTAANVQKWFGTTNP